MGRFNGNNNQGTFRQFIERRNYSINAYGPAGPNLYPRPVRDFNYAERVLYGRINKTHDPIFLLTSNLVPLHTQPLAGPVLRAVNFVADAFDKFVIEWNAAAASGRLDVSDPTLSTIEPRKAFVDYNETYNTYKRSLRGTFLGVYLTKERNKTITDFASFEKIFWNYILEVSSTYPITKTSFITSVFAGPMISGLCVEVADLDASNDADKERFINSPNFGFYKLFANNNGFSIDKQVPWRLVADIASPQMLGYSARYGYTTETQILKSCYARVGGKDIFDLQQMAIDFYNTLTRVYPSVRIPSTLSYTAQCGSRFITRSPVTIISVLERHPLYFWLDKYIRIRYNEQGKPLSEGALMELRKTINKFQNFANMEKNSITAINNSIKTFDKFKGSYARRVLDRQNAADGTDVQPTY